MGLHTPYAATPDHPLPPVHEDGWTCIDSPDHLHFAAARQYAASGVIGELPPAHYQDVRTSTGLYRFFHYASPEGGQIGALHFSGTIGAPPAEDGRIGDAVVDPLGLFGSNNVTTITSDGQGGLVDGNGGSYQDKNGPGTEPIPQNDGTCTWSPDTTNAAAVAIAQSISYHDTPVPFVDQTAYSTLVGGQPYRFIMWAGDCVGDGGTYHCVSVFKCTPVAPGPGPNPNPNPSPSSGGSSSGMGILFAVLAAVLGIGGGIAVAQSSKKKEHRP